ncbi:UvrD-like helicase family protein [Micromonospora sp. Llam0]|uniref:UvrD-helicase domain-containing protein n=1 Tax=Micromonospora sp. Llam0 TaxID=2485143 RepID=UPI000F49B6ED|nr:UvrD-helicase domain-containing protein [Micromonospora sp. Llam0]ROO62971.1 UvrD-like helicase family protein [Micromonospora sp. Llam0]
MTARLSLYRKAEQELYKLDRVVKAQFYDFCHIFRQNPEQPGLDLKKLKGDSRTYRAKINQSYRALLAPVGVDADGTQSWLVVAVRHRKDVYDELQVAVNRVTGEIEFVDLAVVGDSALRRAGITLTTAEPDIDPATKPTPEAPATPPARPLLAGYDADQLRELGVADQIVDLALAVTNDAELDELLEGAPPLSKDILYGLAAGMGIDAVREEITAPVQLDQEPDPADLAAAFARTKVTTVDKHVQAAIEEGDFRAWRVYLHPAQEKIIGRQYGGPTRVSGGPGTGKTVVALHRVKHLAEALPPGTDKPILVTTFTANLANDLRLRLASLIEPHLLTRVDVTHIDQLAARAVGENTTQRTRKRRINDHAAVTEMRQLLLELDEHRWDADFLVEEWEQVILGQAVQSRSDYFQVRRAGRGRALSRPERSQVWKLIEQLTARLNKLGVETWGQAAERAARYEMERAATIEARRTAGSSTNDGSSSGHLSYRYRHIVVDEAQDLRAAHWKMLRAMADPNLPDDIFIAGDTHQRIYNHQVSLGALGIHIRGRSARLTLSYRTTREILVRALLIADDKSISYDDLDDGTDTLAGYRSILHGPPPAFAGYGTWEDELAGLATTLAHWRAELSTSENGVSLDPGGHIAVCVTDHERVSQVMDYLTAKAGMTCAELTKDGPVGDGAIHVGTMHRFKGLEYQRLAIVGASEGVLPRAGAERYRKEDPVRYERELRKARSLLFVAATRARDALALSWHNAPSPLLAAVPVPSDRD